MLVITKHSCNSCKENKNDGPAEFQGDVYLLYCHKINNESGKKIKTIVKNIKV
jgi:hypothetical protein